VANGVQPDCLQKEINQIPYNLILTYLLKYIKVDPKADIIIISSKLP